MDKYLTSANFERDVFEELTRDNSLYSPLKVSIKESVQKNNDGVVKVEWADRLISLNAEIVNKSSPKLISNKIRNIKENNPFLELLMIVPNLSSSILDILKKYQVSGIDLNGNYYITEPDLLAIRLDRKNKFKESTPIKKIYSGTSSVVSRYLLCTSVIPKEVGKITDEIKERGCDITISTVSKVLKRLEEDLILSRSSKAFKLLQKDKLLDNLSNEYIPPKITRQRKLKVPIGPLKFLKDARTNEGIKWCLTGDSSAAKYTSGAFPVAQEVYIESIPKDWLQWEDDRFYNIVLNETESSFVYFDNKVFDGLPLSSKLQSYLELATGDKRQKEISASLRTDLMR